MSALTKRTGTSFLSAYGPLSRVAKEFGAEENVLTIALKPGQRHLEGSIFQTLQLLFTMIDEKTAKLQKDRARRLVDLMIEDVKLSPVEIVEATMRADTIGHLVSEGNWLTAAEVARKGRYSKSNLAAPANRWKREGKVFAVPFKGQDLFAAYQFDQSMKPLPAIASVLKALHKTDPWKIAAWFGSANGWLRGKRPQDCLDDPQAVIDAAKQEAAGFDG